MLKEVKDVGREVLLAVFPITIAVTVLQFSLIFMPAEIFVRFLLGTIMVVAGLVLFLIGVRVGFLPVGEMIGADLPQKGSLLILLVFSFILGFAITAAEPDVRVLAHQVDIVSGGYIGQYLLILAVALGVGFFVALAMVRIVFRLPIAYLLLGGYVLVLILAFFTPADFLPVAFDAGGVTTGPLTAPFVLSLGIGTSSVLGGRSSFSDGFGLVGLASIGPIIAVMLLGVFLG